MFIRKDDIDLAVDMDGPFLHGKNWFISSRRYLGSVRVPNSSLVRGHRLCDLYVSISNAHPFVNETWRPVVYAFSSSNCQYRFIGEAIKLPWDWRQALRTADELVLKGWWGILNPKQG